MDVTVRCICPMVAGKPRHVDDTITFADVLSFRDATAAQKDMALFIGDDDESTSGDALAVLTEQYILRGITAWTLIDVNGAPIEPTRTAIRAYVLSDWDIAQTVSTTVEPLYNPQVLLPLLERASRLSPDGPTDESTSAPTVSPAKRPKQSKPSSTSITPTDDTATITSLHDGASKSSPNATSAA